MNNLIYKMQDELRDLNCYTHVLSDTINYRIENSDEVEYISPLIKTILEKSNQLITDCDDLDTMLQGLEPKLQNYSD